MSRTSTTTETQTHLRVVGYDVHPSNTSPSNDTETQDEPTSTSEQLTDAHSESPEWASHYRRIPPYRPVNRNLDRGERLQFINNAERAFITMMFLGVRNNAVCFPILFCSHLVEHGTDICAAANEVSKTEIE